MDDLSNMLGEQASEAIKSLLPQRSPLPGQAPMPLALRLGGPREVEMPPPMKRARYSRLNPEADSASVLICSLDTAQPQLRQPQQPQPQLRQPQPQPQHQQQPQVWMPPEGYICVPTDGYNALVARLTAAEELLATLGMAWSQGTLQQQQPYPQLQDYGMQQPPPSPSPPPPQMQPSPPPSPPPIPASPAQMQLGGLSGGLIGEQLEGDPWGLQADDDGGLPNFGRGWPDA